VAGVWWERFASTSPIPSLPSFLPSSLSTDLLPPAWLPLQDGAEGGGEGGGEGGVREEGPGVEAGEVEGAAGGEELQGGACTWHRSGVDG
jgi:hypothetical protein